MRQRRLDRILSKLRRGFVLVWYVRDNSRWLERDDRSGHYYKADEVTTEEYDYLMYEKKAIRKEGDYCFPGTTRFDRTVYIAAPKILKGELK